MSHPQDDIRQKGCAKKNPVSCVHAKSKVEFPEKFYPGENFPKAKLKIRLHVNESPNCIEN